MKRYSHYHRRVSSGILPFCLVLLGYVPLGFAGASSTATTSAVSCDQSVEELAVPSAPVLPGSSSTRPDLIVASLEKDLDLLEQETRAMQARLDQLGSNEHEVASASFPKLNGLTRSIASKAAALQQHYSQARDQRRLDVATWLKTTADQMTQMVGTLVTQSRSTQRQSLMTSILTNIANMKHESLKAIAQNLRG